MSVCVVCVEMKQKSISSQSNRSEEYTDGLHHFGLSLFYSSLLKSRSTHALITFLSLSVNDADSSSDRFITFTKR